MDFQANLIRVRKARGMTQEELANRLNVSRQAVSKWETGESLPDLYKLASLADALDISMDELCGHTPPEQPTASEAERSVPAADHSVHHAPPTARLHPRRCILALLLVLCCLSAALAVRQLIRDRAADLTSDGTPGEIHAPTPLPDTIAVSGLTFELDNAALVVRFVPSVSGEGLSWTVDCSPESAYLSVETSMDGGICTARIRNLPERAVTLSATVTNGAERRSVGLATELQIWDGCISWQPVP